MVMTDALIAPAYHLTICQGLLAERIVRAERVARAARLAKAVRIASNL